MATTRRAALHSALAATGAARTRHFIDARPPAFLKRSPSPRTPSIKRDGAALPPRARPRQALPTAATAGRPLALSVSYPLRSLLSSLDSPCAFRRSPLSLAFLPTGPHISAELGPTPVAPRDPGPPPPPRHGPAQPCRLPVFSASYGARSPGCR
ncbi:hypothetical protein ACSSS7_007388 [Eimeria intestinalis]